MHLSEIAFKLHAFVYNYSNVKPQKGGLIEDPTVGRACWQIRQNVQEETPF